VRQRDPALIASLDGRFSQRFDECLEEFGWRAEGWGRYHIPTWAEDRRLPLGLIAHYLESEDSPATAMARAREQREAALRAAESRLEGEKLDRFREMLAASLAHTRISEGRAFWQLVIDGSMRVPLLALGGRLVEASVIEDANDVFFLRLDELRAAAGDPSRRFQDTVASRKADLARWEKLEPPPFVGAPGGRDLIPPIFKRAFARFWGEEAPPSEDVNVVTGNAAGRGSVRGRARLVMSLGEAGRLETGDVLVCPSTAPPWTPLFAIAAAVVTDTGGVLSHSAICAREYGIPAVVGTRTGTQRIPDGATVTVDGTAGTVRIER
jgi:pyruvate,water dikinase